MKIKQHLRHASCMCGVVFGKVAQVGKIGRVAWAWLDTRASALLVSSPTVYAHDDTNYGQHVAVFGYPSVFGMHRR